MPGIMSEGSVASSLVPGMEHAEEADLGSEMSGVASDFEKGFCAGTKQQTIDHFLVLQGQRSQFPRQRKDDMDVGRGAAVRSAAPGASVRGRPL